MDQPNRRPSFDQDAPPTLTTLQVIQSVAWSFFGVQSAKNRERDFTRGDPWQFIFIGVVMTVFVVLVFWVAVQLALHLGNAAP